MVISLAAALLLLAPAGQAQPTPHPGAERALRGIVLERDFGDNLKFHSREVLTLADNSRVRGLNGLMFVRWKGPDAGTEVVASVQWFENTRELLPFYRAAKSRAELGLVSIDDTVIWKTSESSYLWTDGGHFVVAIGGSPAPSKEMLRAWLALIESRPPDLAKLPSAAP